MSILVGADICPIEANRPFFEAGDAASLFHDLLPEFEAADLVIANLECPLIERRTPILKTGPTFGESPACIRGIKAAGIDVLCLANNHCMDHGATGLSHTMRVCREAGIDTVGAGPTLREAGRILIRKIGEVRVGILACAENEFSIAGPDRWGANPLDLIEFVRSVAANRDEMDHLLVLLHGAAEFHVPTPRIQQTCRFMVEMGASVVIVQHPHVLGGYERYRDGHIIYGQGALVMDEAIYRSRKSFHEGFLARIRLRPNAAPLVDWIPFTQSDPPPGARRMPASRERKFLSALEILSGSLEPEAVQRAWREYCRRRRRGYLGSLLGHGRVVRTLNRWGWLDAILFRKSCLAGARNVVCCETHREALEVLFDEMFRSPPSGPSGESEEVGTVPDPPDSGGNGRCVRRGGFRKALRKPRGVDGGG